MIVFSLAYILIYQHSGVNLVAIEDKLKYTSFLTKHTILLYGLQMILKFLRSICYHIR